MKLPFAVRGARPDWALGAAALLAAGIGLALAAPAGAQAAGPTATFAKTSDWGNGFVGEYVIRNDSPAPLTDWKLEFDLPATEKVTSAWSGKLSSSANHYVVTGEEWTRKIAPGGSARVGFQGEYSGQFVAPQNCTLNGRPCSDGGPAPGPDTTAPTAPSGLAASSATASSVDLRWNAATDNVGVAGYAIYSGSTQVATTSQTSATVTGLAPATSYTFTVRARDAAGNLSPASGSVTAKTAAAAAGGITATFAKNDDWGSGFVGEYVIRNGSTTPLNGWKLEFDLPAGEKVTSAWSARLSSSGNHYVLTDEEWTRRVEPGNSVKVGFEGEYGGQFVAPKNCTLNGQPCADGGPTPPDTIAPSAPTGLTAGTATASSIALRWNPATDDVGVDRYAIYSGSTQVATTTQISATVTGLSPATDYAFTVRAIDAAGNLSPASVPASARTAPAGGDGGGSGATPPSFAPYVDMTLTSDSLAEMMSASGASHYSLAFIVSGGACQASWGGYYGIDDPVMNRRINDLKAAGGDAIVSFGGAINQELARTCTSVDALAGQYQAVIDQYDIRDLDFDIEGADQTDAASLERRFKAIAQVQRAGLAAGKPVRISLTLPVMPTGLTANGLNVVRSAIAHGVDVGTVNVMAMDYFDPSLDYEGMMGEYAIQAATATHDQLAELYPGRTDAQLWRMVGVTPMLGINDNPEEVFTIADAAQLTSFANQKGLGRLSMWSINRDAPCPAPTEWTSNTCSGVPDQRWAFSSAFNRFGLV